MITREELAKMSTEEVGRLFHKKRSECRTSAQFGEMISNDREYLIIKEQVIKNLRKTYNK